MRRNRLIWGLAALNALLLVALTWKLGGEPTAHAQAGVRGDFIMVPAKVSGANNGVVYMVDTRNMQLSAFIFDSNRKSLDVMDPIDLNRIMQAGGVGAGNRNKGGGRN
jgi:hypothetical protein